MNSRLKNRGRLDELDALRGFSLYGILLVNIFIFHAPYSYYGEFYGAFQNGESLVIEGVVRFIGGKFLFLFAFLFGYGIHLQQQSRENGFNSYFMKRMGVLLLFGLSHLLLFWFGDILTSYALLGLLIIPTLTFGNRTILSFGIVFLLFRPLYYVGAVLFHWSMVEMGKPAEFDVFVSTFQEGSYTAVFNLRLAELLAFMPENFVWYIPKTIGLFYFGIWAARKNLISQMKEHTAKFLVLSLSLILIASFWEIFKIDFFGKFNLEETPLYRPLLIVFVVVFESALALGYLIAFILLFQKSKATASLFAKPGRMALSNYILQSLICVGIFYSYGLGLYTQLKPSNLILIATVIFAINVVWSHLYLKFNKTGPLEYLWSRLTSSKKID